VIPGRDTERTATRPTATVLGLVIGLALGFAGAFGGFTAFLVVLVLGALGLGVGLALDGRIDPVSWFDKDRRDR
jgi:L-cystine uptake protein TcyP (sodium:dicarboxylate symporter family)